MPDHPNGFSVTVKGPGMFALEGELDIASRPILEAAFAESLVTGGPVVLEMSGLRFMDSSGLATVLSALEVLPSGCLVLHGVNGSTERLMAITGLGHQRRLHVIPCVEKL